MAAFMALDAKSPKVLRAEVPGAAVGPEAIVIDAAPQFEISPYLYMQFMEPLGATDGSVEAAWSYATDDWRRDFVETTAALAPGALRFGGLFSRYYKWRDGIGPAEKRPARRNFIWGGKETNRVGMSEFVDFCRRVGAAPLYCVNFLGDGRRQYLATPEGNRTGDAREAADWVSYANDPDNRERKDAGGTGPYGIKLWQLGNETSYGSDGFTREEAVSHTVEFAKAMRERDPAIQLIGWGDNGWVRELVERAGEQIDYVAVHMMGQRPLRPNTILNSLDYQKAPERAWEELMEMTGPRIEEKLLALESELANLKSRHAIAITEGHLSLQPGNINPILTEWLTGVYHARALNLYQRHGARVKIATAADFNGTRWTTNAMMLQMPGGISYLNPAGAVMRLFKGHNGKEGVAVKRAPGQLDLAASRTGDRFFLHAANLNFSKTIEASFEIPGLTIKSAQVFEIAPEDPRQAATQSNPEIFNAREHPLAGGGQFRHRFPARSVSAVELECATV